MPGPFLVSMPGSSDAAAESQSVARIIDVDRGVAGQRDRRFNTVCATEHRDLRGVAAAIEDERSTGSRRDCIRIWIVELDRADAFVAIECDAAGTWLGY